MSIEQQLIDFTNGPVEQEPIAMMRLSLFDWAACGMAAVNEPVARILREKATEDGGAAHSTMLGGGKVPMRAAAVVNGTTSHALDFDDTHFGHIGHPSVAVVPAALAVAERQGADVQTLLAACLIGVEASIRFGLWLGRGHYQIGFHQTATAGAIGATLASCRLMGTTEAQTAHALGLAATRSSGLKSQFGTMGKPYNAGLAAETGVEAADLALRGMTSAVEGLSGLQGLGPTHAGAADLSGFDGLGQTWQFETISHKFYACCHGLHAMIEAVRSSGVDAAAVDAVTINTHPRWMTVCNVPEPMTGLAAKFSYRLTCAMALRGADLGAIQTFSDAACTNPALTRIRNRVEVVADPTLTEMQARVTIRLGSGETVIVCHDLAAPIPFDQRVGKLRAKARSLLGEASSNELWEAVNAPDIAGLVYSLSRP